MSVADRAKAAVGTVEGLYHTLMAMHNGDYPAAMKAVQAVHDSYTKVTAPTPAGAQAVLSGKGK